VCLIDVLERLDMIGGLIDVLGKDWMWLVG
jgi:hypothetical protein